MTTYAIEGQGATIAFGTSTYVSDVLSIGMPSRTRETLPTTHLGTTLAKTYKPAKLEDVGDLEIEFDHNPAAANLLLGNPETITLSYPLLSGQTTPARKTFTAFAIKQGGEEFKTDAKLTTKVTLKISGPLTDVAAT